MKEGSSREERSRKGESSDMPPATLLQSKHFTEDRLERDRKRRFSKTQLKIQHIILVPQIKYLGGSKATSIWMPTVSSGCRFFLGSVKWDRLLAISAYTEIATSRLSPSVCINDRVIRTSFISIFMLECKLNLHIST
ncbi:uncharacterized protein G2W53_011818 [Senna tora]|uniref:Uncharacterized protein n=1 Tax=Senna tora TaxID=362788 RepID=A0A834TVU7_9FABA|nr:uncharacterized protein G2W53_011818 [Senna tora]